MSLTPVTSWRAQENFASIQEEYIKPGSNFVIKFIIFHIHTVHLDIIKVFYSTTDEQVNCLKNNFKIYIKIGIKTAPTCFNAVTPSSGSALLVLAKVTVVKMVN
jgi:hypothetical protein